MRHPHIVIHIKLFNYYIMLNIQTYYLRHHLSNNSVLLFATTPVCLVFLSKLFDQTIIITIVGLCCSFHLTRSVKLRVCTNKVTCVTSHVPDLFDGDWRGPPFTSAVYVGLITE